MTFPTEPAPFSSPATTVAIVLWQIADEFRNWVTREMDAAESRDRFPLRGDYLFVVNGSPHFLVLVEERGCTSGRIHFESQRPKLALDEPLDRPMSEDHLQALLNGGARATIATDDTTLKRLLLGSLKARNAFLTGKVKIEGDLPGFMRLVSLLKTRGVRPLGRFPEATQEHA